ncbi:uncharacterized protein LOC123218641 [Mangifera indica]|uniref:uncharacterized protein LOC123218641 n=1 Tax=Mangifera indica TaxID=29780 RepID=UPI001CFB8EF2|nr:uncharacterized protein LOC123218641 [Mangifera indica]XP_044496100.1 uncharacterized protein LOC123218641 [Mangifera indica]
MASGFSAEDKLLEGGRLSDREEEEEEEEALSLSDLPLNLINIQDNRVDQNQSRDEPRCQVKDPEDQEFNFGSWGGSLSTESEMCAADDVFFKGQILPLRFSVSSESGLTRLTQHDSSRNSATSCLSRSESMDHLSSVDRLTSINSSTSSSSRSHNSSTTTTSATTTTKNSNPRIIRNQFHTYPSPKPQIRVSTSQLRRNTSGNRTQKSTVWKFFRVGLVRTPDIELQDVKVRHKSCVSRNSSSGSSSSSIKNYSKQDLKIMGKKHKKKQNLLDKKMGLFSGCKCSITAVETVPLNNIVLIKSEGEVSRINNGGSSSGKEKKLHELKIKQKMKEKQQGKQAMSRHRTFEWLKELSHASYVDGEKLD